MTDKFPGGIEVHGRVTPEYRQILSDDALSFVAKLHRAFEGRRQELLAKRQARQKDFDAGKLPDFLPDTKQIRESEWKICNQPKDLLDRRVADQSAHPAVVGAGRSAALDVTENGHPRIFAEPFLQHLTHVVGADGIARAVRRDPPRTVEARICADAVIATSTRAPALSSRRTSSAAL